MSEREAFEAFGRWCMEQLRDEALGCDIDGGDAQEKLKELGLLVEVEVTEPCGDGCHCAEWDDFPQTCLRPAAEHPK